MFNGSIGGVSNGDGNVSWSRQLADELDAKDGKKDGKIDACVWNAFMKASGSKGKTINNFITTDRAVKSFEHYNNTKDKGKIGWQNGLQTVFSDLNDENKVENISTPQQSVISTQNDSVHAQSENSTKSNNDLDKNAFREFKFLYHPLRKDVGSITVNGEKMVIGRNFGGKPLSVLRLNNEQKIDYFYFDTQEELVKFLKDPSNNFGQNPGLALQDLDINE